MRLNKERIHSNLELLLYSLGVGPVFTSLLLYYLLLFSPHKSYFFYLSGVFIIYLFLLLLGRKHFSVLWTDIIKKTKNTKKRFKNLNTYHQKELIIFASILIIFLASFLFLYLTNTLQTPLDGTDALRHGTFGKIFFVEKSLEYRWIRLYPKGGFYLQVNHAPSFSLILTWEKIMDSFFNADKDLYFKSISTYYTLLILCIIFFWLFRKNKYLALLGILALLSGFSFFQTLILQHLDSYRIFFLIISWIFLGYAIEKKDSLSFLLLGIFSGFAAFSHTIGAVLVVFNCLTLFIFTKGNFKSKLSRTTFVTILVITFGWFHYILDIIWGFGWIIFKREITWWG
jgi:hypothetical protein